MRKKIIGCIVVLSLGALVSSGCAKKDLVKSEEPVSTAQTVPTTPPEAAPPQPMQPMEEIPMPVNTTAQNRRRRSLDFSIFGRPLMATGTTG